MNMNEILARLNEATGAKGSLVVTSDGILVAGVLGGGIRKDVVAALSSFLISATARCLSEGRIGSFGRMTVTATHGKVVVSSFKDYFLVVLTDQFAGMDETLRGVSEAASRLRKLTKIKV